MRNSMLVVVAALGLSACGGATAAMAGVASPPSVPNAPGLQFITGGSASNFGSAELATGFLPDPHQVQIVSGAMPGNAVEVANLGLQTNNSGSCRGYATAQPDYIVHVPAAGSMLRFRFDAPGDTTLVINDGAGHWWCSDDDGGNLNPEIIMNGPATGQYDIWVGSYRAGENISGVLSISELPGS